MQSRHTNYLVGRHGIAKNYTVDEDYLENQMKSQRRTMSDLRKDKKVNEMKMS
jgi:hypothetical protein